MRVRAMRPQTNKERQAAFRDNMKKKGLVQVMYWVHPDKEAEVRQFVKSLEDNKWKL